MEPSYRAHRPSAVRSAASILAALLAVAPAALVAAAPKPATRPTSRAVPRQQQIDYGPFVTATISPQWPDGGVVNKAIAVRLAVPAGGGGQPPGGGGVLFDTDACRVAAGWVGGFVEFTKDWAAVRDARSVQLVGTQTFGTKPGPGWADPTSPDSEKFKDPRGRDVRPERHGRPRDRSAPKVTALSIKHRDPMPGVEVGSQGLVRRVDEQDVHGPLPVRVLPGELPRRQGRVLCKDG